MGPGLAREAIGLLLGLAQCKNLARDIAAAIERDPAHVAAPVGGVGLGHVAAAVQGVGELREVCVGVSLLLDPAVGVVVVGEGDVAARILERAHVVRGVVGVVAHAALRIGGGVQPPARVVGVVPDAVGVVLRLRDAVAGVVGELDPAPVGRGYL